MLPSYIAEGLRLERIASTQAYQKGGYRTLKEYCRRELGIGSVQGFRLRKAAKLASELGITLPSEYHCRLLAKLSPAQRLELCGSFNLEAMPETILACLVNVKLGKPVTHPNGKGYVKVKGHRLSIEQKQYLKERLIGQWETYLATEPADKLPEARMIEAWDWAWDQKLAIIEERLAELREKHKADHTRALGIQINELRKQKTKIEERIEKLDERLLQNAQKTWGALCDDD